MPDRPVHVRFNGERVLGVDANGSIALVLGIVGAPTPLWGELLEAADGRPDVVSYLKVSRPDGAPTDAPTQIDLRVGAPDDIRPTLDWLATAIAATNERHDAHAVHLAEIYRISRSSLEAWFAGARPSVVEPNPRLN